MSQLFEGFANIEISMDDMLIHAESLDRLNELTELALNKLMNAGLKLNKEKCVFNQTTVKFLGHIVSNEGLRADPEKINDIQHLQRPVNKKGIERFLGSINYLRKFIDNLSELTHPLRLLLQSGTDFKWEDNQESSFQILKQKLSDLPLLKYYDVNKLNVLSADCSSHSIGAVLFQDGCPIAYASKALTSTQQSYPQIEKEALALRFACEKFHPYIFGKELILETDHKPLESIFLKTLDRVPPRLKRLMLDVKPYNPKVIYKKGSTIPIPDMLSRDVLKKCEISQKEEVHVQVVSCIPSNLANTIKAEIAQNEILQELVETIIVGWPEKVHKLKPYLRTYWTFREELSTYDGLIWKGDQLIIPGKLKDHIMKQLHTGHLGADSCIKLAKQIVYWNEMIKDIRAYIDRCPTCNKFEKNNQKNKLQLRRIPEYPFQVVASDIFHYQSKNYIVIIDSYSGWVDYKPLKTMQSSEVISILQTWFSIMGVPEEFQSDNGAQYDSREFKQFEKEYNFTRASSSPLHPQSNGLAERAVQIVKNIIKKCTDDNSSIQMALQNYRNTPRNNILMSPNERLMSRKTRSPIPTSILQLKPKVVVGVTKELECLRKLQKENYDKNAKESESYNVGEQVLIQNPHSKLWKEGTVISHTNFPRSVIVSIDGKRYRRNFIHLEKVFKPYTRTNENDTSNSTFLQHLQAPLLSNNFVHTPTDHPSEPLHSPELLEPAELQQPPEHLLTRPQHPLPPISEASNTLDSSFSSNEDFSTPPLITRTSRSGRIIKPIKKLNL